MLPRKLFAGLAILATTIAPPPRKGSADDWPQFRGINCSGISRESHSLPAEFSRTKNQRWQVPLKDGIASPIVVGDRVFVTQMSGPELFSVNCIDAATGNVLWQHDEPTGKLPPITAPNSHASSTPVSDGKGVYVYFSTIGLIALDATTGDLLWTHPIAAPSYLMDWGAASSPILCNGKVILGCDDDLYPHLLAVDMQTGETAWDVSRPDMLAGYATPVICEVNGRKDIVVAGTGRMQGYNPASGDLTWTCNTLLRTIMTTPVVSDDTIYISVQSYGDADRTIKFALLQWKDTNQDGKLSPDELPSTFAERFAQADVDQNGFLEGKELDTAFQSANNQVGGGNIIQAIRGGGTGDVTKTHLTWNQDHNGASNMASPLVVNNRLFVVKKGGISGCFDASSGQNLWENKRIGNFGDYFASPVAGDGKIYFVGENGVVTVLADAPKPKILAKNDLGAGGCLATPAISQGRIYFRTRESLICVANSD